MNSSLRFLLNSGVASLVMVAAAHDHPDHDDTTLKANKVSITVEGEYRIIKSNGWPDHAPGEFPRRGNPNTVAPQSYTFKVPLKPAIAKEAPPRGMWWWGVALNGVPFEPGTAETWKNDPRSE
ncbi:MAG: hypothetical protein RL693_2476, partial [Verrucomicrobiota bacterium]